MEENSSFKVYKGLAEQTVILASDQRHGFSYSLLDQLIAIDQENGDSKNNTKPVDASLGNYHQQVSFIRG